jgi:hypothetical protein
MNENLVEIPPMKEFVTEGQPEVYVQKGASFTINMGNYTSVRVEAVYGLKGTLDKLNEIDTFITNLYESKLGVMIEEAHGVPKEVLVK